MKRALVVLFTLVIIPILLNITPATGAGYQPEYRQVADRYGYDLLSPEELDDLLAPIALYPDPLIAQILPAATFVDQIDNAARFVRRYGTARVDYQPWDISVRAIAHYPRVLYMMERDYDWTVALGQAFIEQPQDVMDAVQRLRDYAWAQGNLYSTPEQEVVYETGYIRIIPARPRYVYIPVYDPYTVYVESYSPSYPLITFSVGFTIGAWLNRDCDWRERRVYYHGWRGSRWVTRSRPHIHDRRGVYITPRASTINVNTRVFQRDTSGLRSRLRTEGLHREGVRVPTSRIRTEQPRPGRIERPAPGRLEQTRPGATEQRRTRTGAPPRATVPEQRRPRIIETPGATAPAPAGRAVQPAPATPETVRPGRPAQPGSGVIIQPGTGRTVQPRTGGTEQAPAVQQRRPGRDVPGGERRREMRQINRPTTPQSPAVTPPAPAAPQPPARIVVPSVTAPPPAAAPAPAPPAPATPRIIGPSLGNTPIPAPSRSVEPTQPRVREQGSEPRGGRSGDRSGPRGGRSDDDSGQRAAPREGR